MRRAERTAAVVAALAVGLAVCAGVATPGTTARAADLDPCAIQGVERIVAVGDVHGAYDRFVEILEAAGVVDGRARWRGGTTHLIQLGDVLDRGDDSRRVLDLLRKLEGEAERRGGRVHFVLGNHEVMRMVGDWRMVSDGEYRAFRNRDSERLRDVYYGHLEEERRSAAEQKGQTFDAGAFRTAFFESTPLGALEMARAFGSEGEYGEWLRSRPAALRIDGTLFLHGGVSPQRAPLGCAGINEAVRRELTTGFEAFRADPLNSVSAAEDGPLWYRGLAREDEASFAPEVERILEAVEARRIVIAHTVTESRRITPRFGGRVVMIDTGMLDGDFFPSGVASALEIRGDTVTAIYADGRTGVSADDPGAACAVASCH